jgi:sugar/nucleoside kinase (ribokinase family)
MSKAIIIGNICLDLVLGEIPNYPEWGTEVLLPGYVMRPGGAALNAALALSSLGVPTFIVGTLGKDDFGRRILSCLEHSKIHTDFLFVIPEKQTGLSVGITNAYTKERSFLTELGAQESLSLDHLESIVSFLEEGDFVLLCGYFLSPRLRTSRLSSLLLTYYERGARLLLDTGWPPEGWTKRVCQEVRNLLPLFDYFLPNEEEFEKVCGMDQDLAFLSRKGTIVKKGEKGCEAHTSHGIIFQPTVKVKAVDTIGAGDYFNAGFIFALWKGYSLPLALRCANLVASFNISSSPQRESLVKRETIERVIAGKD